MPGTIRRLATGARFAGVGPGSLLREVGLHSQLFLRDTEALSLLPWAYGRAVGNWFALDSPRSSRRAMAAAPTELNSSPPPPLPPLPPLFSYSFKITLLLNPQVKKRPQLG